MCGTICVWGDSIAKGIVFDEERGRYAILRENCLRLLETDKVLLRQVGSADRDR